MDKYDLVLDIIEQPEKYPSDRLQELLSDPETREIYNLLSKTDSAVEAASIPDVEAEWEAFSRKHIAVRRRRFMWAGSRAASVTALVLSSLVAVAVGIAITVKVTERPSSPTTESVATEKHASVTTQVKETVMQPQNDTIAQTAAVPIMFENESLENIMAAVADSYGVEVIFNNKEASLLHLYYRLDTDLTLDEVITQLNTFEQINIKRNGNILTIE